MPGLDVFFHGGVAAATVAAAGGGKIPIRTSGYLAPRPFTVDINYSTELDHIANILV